MVWQILQALRSHDDRFDAMINKLDLIGKDTSKMEVIAITDKIQKKQRKRPRAPSKQGRGQGRLQPSANRPNNGPARTTKRDLQFEIGEIERAIYAKMVKKCGNRHHWEDWANDIAKIARTHIDRITGILGRPENTKEREAFDAFADELRDDLNDSITDGEVIEMLAQHLITRPVFDALFEGYSFASTTPCRRPCRACWTCWTSTTWTRKPTPCRRFYDSVRMRAEGIDNAAGKQKIVVELYDKFFRNAFPKHDRAAGHRLHAGGGGGFHHPQRQRRAANRVRPDAGQQGRAIIDPFTGTGTFITRLLQSGPDHARANCRTNTSTKSTPTKSCCWPTTSPPSISRRSTTASSAATTAVRGHLPDRHIPAVREGRSGRRPAGGQQRRGASGRRSWTSGSSSATRRIRSGQRSDNDNNAQRRLPALGCNAFASTYAAAFQRDAPEGPLRQLHPRDPLGQRPDRQQRRDRLCHQCRVCRANTADGLRKCLAEEFTSIYVFHLRGNQRTSGELSRKEGGKIFGSGSRAPIAISLLVKNPDAAQHGQIHFHDIGDYLSREEKLQKISDFASIGGIAEAEGWQTITPDAHGDWLKQRDDSFGDYIVLGRQEGRYAQAVSKLLAGRSNEPRCMVLQRLQSRRCCTT